MKKLLSLGLAVLLTVSLAICLPVAVLADDAGEVVAEPTFTYDFSAYCSAENYGFGGLSDVAVSGGTLGYYTFTATEDEVGAGLDPQAYLPAPDVDTAALSYAVILYRTESLVRGEIFVDRTDDVIMGQSGSHVYWQYEDDGEWHLELIDASDVWGDVLDVQLNRFRFDPLALCEEGDSVDVSYIKFFAIEEDAQAYVDANGELLGDYGTTEQVVERNGKIYGYTNKVEVEYSHHTTVEETLDWDMSTSTDSSNMNHSFLLKDLEDPTTALKNGQVISWKAGGYENANHPLYALYGHDGNYLKFESLPFAEYDRVTVILCSSGEAHSPWVVGFVSDENELLGTDLENLNETAAIVYGECAPAEEGQVNISGLGTGVSWNTAERAVTMNIEGTDWDGPAALYVGSYDGHIAVVLKILFQRDVLADVYVDAEGNEYIDGEALIREEDDGLYYLYDGLFDVTATEVDGETVYEYDFREYYAAAPAVPSAPTHTITFVDEKGNVVATYTFTEGSTVVDWTAPEVPAKEGYIGSWNAYTLGGSVDLTVKPRYSLAPVTPVPGPEESTTDVLDTETEALTTEAVEDTTADDTTAAVDTNKAEDTTAPAAEGCKAVIASASVLGVIALGAGAVICKKKD